MKSRLGISPRIIPALIALALLACGIFFAIQNHSTPPSNRLPIRVVFKANANYLIYFVAREKGFLSDAGLAVEEIEMESSNLMIQALASGQADFNPSTSVPVLYAAEQSAPGTFQFLFITLMEKGRANDAIIVKKGSAIKSLADLKGKRVGSPPGATSIILLKLIFDKVGLDVEKDLSIQELEPRVQLQALAADQIDALLAIEPIITMGQEKGISQVLESEPIENNIMNPIPIAGGVVTARFAKANPAVVKRLQKAMEQSIDYIRSHEDESRMTMAKAIGMSEQTANRLGINTYWKSQEVDKELVQKLADLFQERGALQSRVDTKKMYLEFNR